MKEVGYYFLWVQFVLLMVIVLLFSLNSYGSDIETVIRVTALEEGVDPELAVAIAKVESGLNPKLIGGLGEVGTFQLRPEYHVVKLGDLRGNVRTAVRYLAKLQVTHTPKYGDAWFIAYNVGPNYAKPIRYPQKFPYYRKVVAKMNESEQCEGLVKLHERTMQNQNEVIADQADQIREIQYQNDGLKGSLREAHEIYKDTKRKCSMGVL